MKIKEVEAFPVCFPLETPAQDATGVWHSWDTVIVKITAEDGTFGYGEIGPLHGGGVTIFKAIVDTKFSDLLIGELALSGRFGAAYKALVVSQKFTSSVVGRHQPDFADDGESCTENRSLLPCALKRWERIGFVLR